jgi:hypothetical protein
MLIKHVISVNIHIFSPERSPAHLWADCLRLRNDQRLNPGRVPEEGRKESMERGRERRAGRWGSGERISLDRHSDPRKRCSIEEGLGQVGRGGRKLRSLLLCQPLLRARGRAVRRRRGNEGLLKPAVWGQDKAGGRGRRRKGARHEKPRHSELEPENAQQVPALG